MRTPALPTAAPACTTLLSGQQYRLWGGRDGAILVLSGTIALRESPHWLAETMLELNVDLQAGQHYLLQRSGWTCITAAQDCQFLVLAQSSRTGLPLTQLWSFAKTAMQLLRNRTHRLLSLR